MQFNCNIEISEKEKQGYLTGTTNTWNNAKKAELKDRVKHN